MAHSMPQIAGKWLKYFKFSGGACPQNPLALACLRHAGVPSAAPVHFACLSISGYATAPIKPPRTNNSLVSDRLSRLYMAASDHAPVTHIIPSRYQFLVLASDGVTESSCARAFCSPSWSFHLIYLKHEAGLQANIVLCSKCSGRFALLSSEFIVLYHQR